MSDLPAGWTETTLGEIASQGQYGWTSKASEKGQVKYLRTTDITSGHLNWDTVPYCQDNPPNVEKYKIEPGDILISRAGSVGFSALIEDVPSTPAVFASYLIRYIPNSQVNPKFIARFLQSPNYWQQISDASAGIALANVNAKKLANVILPLPPLNEQKRIAEKLDSLLTRVDSCQTHLERVPQILKRFRQSVLAAACEGMLLEQNSEDEPAGIFYERILSERRRLWELKLSKSGSKNKKYTEPEQPDLEDENLPKGWIWASLDSLTYRVTYGITVRPKYVDEGVPIISAKEIRSGEIDLDIANKISQKDFEKLRHNCILYYDDVLFSKTGTIGHVARVKHEMPLSVSQNVAVLSPVVWSKYLEMVLRSPKIQSLAKSQVKTTAIPDLQLGLMKRFPIPLPPLEEQRRIVAEVEKLFAYAERLEARYLSASERVARLTPSLLAKAFRGELVGQEQG